MLTGIVNVRYGRLYRFGRYETHIPSTWLKYRRAFRVARPPQNRGGFMNGHGRFDTELK